MKTIKAVNDKQFQYLIDGLCGEFADRDAALLTILNNTGLRVGETVGLNVGDVRRNGVAVEVMVVREEIAKGGRRREIPLNLKAREAVENAVRILADRGHSTEPTAPLFVSKRGTRLSRRMVQHRFGELRGEHDWITAHKLRHGFATRVLGQTGNVRITQMLLGHANLNTTMIYTHPSNQDLADAVSMI